MADRIRGITVEIAGDTSDLSDALQGITTRSRHLQSELRDVERLLKFNPGNTEALAQRQELLQRQVRNTTERLNQLREAERQVQQQFERGDISEEAYRGFRREIMQTEQELQRFTNALQDMQDEQESVQRSTRQLNQLFQATGSSIDDYVDLLGPQLARSIQQGTANSRQLQSAFQRISREALGSNVDIGQLRQTLAQLDSGSSIDQVRRDLEQLRNSADQARGSVKELGGELVNMAAGIGAAGGIQGAIEKSLEATHLNTKIEVTFDVPEESKESIKRAVLGIQTYGVDAEAALEGVRRQWALNKNETDSVNSAVVRAAGIITSAYAGIDFTELIQENNEVASALGISNSNAIALINSLLKAGFPPEQLDTIAEYGQQMKDIGFDSKQIQNIFESGISTKSWNIDNLNDGVKEARLQMAGFGDEVNDAMTDLLDRAGMSTNDFMEWGKAVAAGGDQGAKAMSEVAAWINGIGDAALKNQLATKVFGTKWEDQGQNMIAVFQGLGNAIDKTTDNQNKLYETMGKMNADPAVELQQAIANMKMELQPLLIGIAEFVTKIANWVAENPKLSATIFAVVSVIGILAGLVMGLLPIISAIGAALPVLGPLFAALTGPIGIAIAVIMALIAAFFLIKKNWGAISKWLTAAWEATTKAAKKVFGGIGKFFSDIWAGITKATKAAWDGVTGFLSGIWDGIVSAASAIWGTLANVFTFVFLLIKNIFVGSWTFITGILKGFWNIIVYMAAPIWNKLVSFFKRIWDGVTSVFSAVWEEITGFLGGIWDDISETAKNVFEPIGEFFSGLWDGITSVWESVWSTISEYLGGIWDGIESAGKSVFDSLSSYFGGIWDGISTTTGNIWDGITSYLGGVWDEIKSVAGSVFDGFASYLSGIWDGIRNTTRTFWDEIKEAVLAPVRGIKTGVQDMIDFVNEMFANLKIEFPKVKLPHFALNGKFSLDPPSVPTLKVDWYKQGGLFPANSPRLVGMGDASVPEAALPLSDSVLGKIAKMITDNMQPNDGGLYVNIENFTNNTEKDIENLANELSFYLKRKTLAKGGN